MPLTPEGLARRADAIHASPDLARLARRLEAFSSELCARPLYLPSAKAMLSQDGGVCEVDGSRLRFDPLEPYRHVCPTCGRLHGGDRHHRAWIWRYHVWLSERAIHFALLGVLLRRPALLGRAREILEAYADLYPTVPNRDNVLGPTRLFFSTYLESIWLLQTVVAASLLAAAGGHRLGGPFDAVVQESAGLIASFNEGLSNRQVWNNAALLAAGQWLDDRALVHRAVAGRFGVRNQLLHGVGQEGLWYEGENYHFFALRGFLLAAELARVSGTDLYADERAGPKLSAMYVAPLETLLPDLSLPARGDAPFGVSVMQPRFAELWEIGRARTGDPRLGSVLSDLYGRGGPEGEDIGLSEIAEQESNRPGHRLARDHLGWKALCWMLPTAPAESPERWASQSRLLRDAGVVVLRPTPGRYVSLECGGRPGGHGHPDLLHLSIYADRPRLLDFGTGSYVSLSLHWYRSALAHNAPSVPRIGQLDREGTCTAFGSDGAWYWCRGEAEGLFGGESRAVRSLVVGPTYALDVVEVTVPEGVEVLLPLHPLVGVCIVGPDGDETPSAEGAEISAGRFRLGERSDSPELVLVRRSGESVRVGRGPGPPSLSLADGAPLTFLVRRASGSGRWMQLYSWEPGTVLGVAERENEVRIALVDGEEETVHLGGDLVLVERAGGALARIERGMALPRHVPMRPPVQVARPSLRCAIVERLPDPDDWDSLLPHDAVITLGAAHYRRSENAYSDALGARVAVFAAGRRLCFAAQVRKPVCHFRAPDAPDSKLDNESPDIHSDGLQCYVGLEDWKGVVAVPDPVPPNVHVRPIAGCAGDGLSVDAAWCRTGDGYSIVVAFDVGWPIGVGERFSVQLVVNEMYPERERRAGQLALSGGGGWVYLRGDRESPLGAVIAEVW